MARIRSIHPGQWTDDEFVGMSFAARLLAIAIRNEADDRGCFEWKPLRIKMRLFPGDEVNVVALLAECEAANQLMRYEVDGKAYGAIRNFCAFQRPKKPSYYCPTTEIVNEYTAFDGGKPRNGDEPEDTEAPDDAPLSPTGSEPVPHQFPTSSEKSPQKGGREEGKKGGREVRSQPQLSTTPRATSAPDPEPPPPVATCAAAGGMEPALLGDQVADILGARDPRWAVAGAHVQRWRATGAADATILDAARTVRAKRDASGQPPPNDPRYLDPVIREMLTGPPARAAPKPAERRSAFGAGPVVR